MWPTTLTGRSRTQRLGQLDPPDPPDRPVRKVLLEHPVSGVLDLKESAALLVQPVPMEPLGLPVLPESAAGLPATFTPNGGVTSTDSGVGIHRSV
jgi:hypothetical protein